MKDRKRRLELFSFNDHAGIERHLEKMAAKGWMLEKMGILWTYRRITPEKRSVTVTYDPGTSVFAPGPSEKQLAFREFCAHDGWQFAAEHGAMQVFYSREENPVPLETDEELQAEACSLAARRSWLPGKMLLLVLCLWHVIIHFIQLGQAQRMFLSENSWMFSFFYWTMGAVLSAGELAGFFIHRSATWWKRGCLAVLSFGILCWLAAFPAASPRVDWVQGTAELLWLGALPLIAGGTCVLLKGRKISAKRNAFATLAVTAVLGLFLAAGALFGLGSAEARGCFEENVELYSYEDVGPAWRKNQKMKAWHDALPLTVEDLVGMPMEGYSYRTVCSNTIFLREYSGSQYCRLDDKGIWEAPDPSYTSDFRGKPQIDYIILEAKWPFLYEVLKDEILSTYDGIDPQILSARYVPVDPAPWGAETAYELRHPQEYQGDHNWLYLLCYEKRIVNISLDWEPSEENKAVVGEKLGR